MRAVSRAFWTGMLSRAAVALTMLALAPAWAMAQSGLPSTLTSPSLQASPGGAAAGAGGHGVGPVTNLPLPRYVSLRSDEINVRRGPGLEYRMDWVFRRSGLPVKIIGEHKDWRQIVDSDNASGWVYHSLLTGSRTVLVTADWARLRARPEPEAQVRAEAERGVVADLRACDRAWCEIEVSNVVGWVPKEVLWGIDAGELWPR